MSLSILNKTRQKAPKIPFEEIKDAVLGRRYDLSLVFVGSSVSRRLNKSLRGKDKPANILSLPLTKSSGEMFIDLGESRKDAPKFGESQKKFVLRLFIHGLLHLKGMDHGRTMDKAETKFLARFRL